MELILPDGTEVKEPTTSDILQRGFLLLHSDLLGVQAQLEVLIRLEAGGAPVRQTWRQKFWEADRLEREAEKEVDLTDSERNEAAFQAEMADMPEYKVEDGGVVES